ncbi:MAG: STAS domain-containing protein [Betaproteobacteria bacterium]|nr:STAS domain-containing protein [Betaproteobacteria bacterium]
MELRLREDLAPGRVELHGAMDIYAAQTLHARLLELLRAHPRLELDLAGVDEIDSAGVQLLMSTKRAAAGQGRNLALVAHSPAVLETLELCQLLGFFGDPVVETAGAAR